MRLNATSFKAGVVASQNEEGLKNLNENVFFSISVKMDRNGDGSVDKKELFSWILRSFKSLSQEESSDRFHDTDDDQASLGTFKATLFQF
jgi:hypothetical protein